MADRTESDTAMIQIETEIWMVISKLTLIHADSVSLPWTYSFCIFDTEQWLDSQSFHWSSLV